jgi:hypothetical protein
MSLEKCELCQEDSTPWKYVKGHICEDCYQCIKKVNNCSISKKDLEKIYPSRNKTEAYVYPCQHQWISVKDRLPLYKQCILILLNGTYVTEAIYRGEYEEGLDVFRIELIMEDIECKLGKYITHWMPLPDAPGGK